jgi:hypothetical protein
MQAASNMKVLIVVFVALGVISLGVLEAFFPASARRLRGLDGRPSDNSTKLVDSDSYVLSFRVGGILMIGFGAVMLWVVLFK